jgi:hypothetical protein
MGLLESTRLLRPVDTPLTEIKTRRTSGTATRNRGGPGIASLLKLQRKTLVSTLCARRQLKRQTLGRTIERHGF